MWQAVPSMKPVGTVTPKALPFTRLTLPDNETGLFVLLGKHSWLHGVARLISPTPSHRHPHPGFPRFSFKPSSRLYRQPSGSRRRRGFPPPSGLRSPLAAVLSHVQPV
nr:hypothetical protein Iba_chr10dCG1820 [Ipomoea batatas]GME12611.1 hypothetical protein Iba_scaffold14018CG0050 [Ipomoea batatas]